jgi:L-cysteine S-thiosulfotransferase
MVHATWRLAGIGVMLAAGMVAAADIPPAERRSGFDFMSPQTQAMQKDDTANPGMLWVLDGERSWRQPEGSAGAACARCHGEDAASMRGVAARYPAFDAESGRPIDLAGRINLCRRTHQGAAPLAVESQELLALTAFVAHQSRGLPVTRTDDPRLERFRESGRKIYERRIGQLDLSCAACHDDNWGKRLGGSPIPQGHPTAYPLYRLEWQGVGSLQRRVRGCMVGVRAEPFAPAAAEWVELELYLMSRAVGLPIETPGVRP